MKSRPWMIEMVETDSKRNQKCIIYPVFLETLPYCTDLMWKDIFQNAAYGKLPKGFVFKDNTLIHKIKSRTFRLELSHDPQMVMRECIQFFQQKGGIFSDQDYTSKNLETDVNINDYSWNDIKRRKLRDLLFYFYVQEQTEMYRLNRKERKQLDEIIELLVLVDIPSSEVELSNGKIKKIKCLKFDETTRQYNISSNIFNIKKPIIEADKNGIFVQHWIQYVRSYDRVCNLETTLRTTE